MRIKQEEAELVTLMKVSCGDVVGVLVSGSKRYCIVNDVENKSLILTDLSTGIGNKFQRSTKCTYYPNAFVDLNVTGSAI